MKKIKSFISIITLLLFVLSVFNIGRVFASPDILKITGVSINDKSQDVDAAVLDYSNDTIRSNVSYHRLNDYTTYKVTIKNTDKIKHIVELLVDNNSADYLEYEYDGYRNTILEPNQEVDVYIKEIFRKQPASLSNRNRSNNVVFTFNLIDEVKNESIINKIVNPRTGDNVYIYVVIAIISFIISILLFATNKKRNSAFAAIIVPLFFLSLPIVTKALDSKDTIRFDNAVNLYSKLGVTFRLNGQDNQVVVNYGKKVKEVETPNQEGYDFEGWYLGENKYDFSAPVKEDILLTGKFVRSTYDITYDLNGGQVRNPNNYKVTELPLTLNNPTKEGYIFKGWTGSNGDIPQTDLTINDVSEDLNYKANFEAINYNIEYIGLTTNEKTSLHNPETYTINQTVTINKPSDRLDSQGEVATKFIGWRDNQGDLSQTVTFTGQTEDKTYEAIWQNIKPDTHSITYELNGGTLGGEENPTEFSNSTPTFTLKNPTKEGYTFKGWIGSNGNTPQLEVKVEKGTTQDLNFEAVFEIINYQITYNLDGGEATNPETYTINQTVTLNNPTKAGYTFTGWTGTDLNEQTLNVTIPANSTGERTYTAHYSLDTYNITYTLDGGVANNPETYTINDDIILLDPVKEGYTFTGWTGSNGTTPSVSVRIINSTGNKEYTAHYQVNPYTVHFDKNDNSATGTMEDQEFDYDEEKALSKNTFTKSGYAFVKWTTNPDGTGTSYTDKQVVSNLIQTGTITLYAQWKKVNISVLINGSDFNVRLKSLAHDSGPRTSTANTSIHKVKFSRDVPQEIIGEGAYRISISSRSDVATYMWWDEDEHTIYYGGEADIIYLNENAMYMYANLMGVTEIDNNYDTSKTTNMEQMYYRCRELVNNNGLSDFDTSNVTTMKNMFGETYKIESYDIKSWDVSKVQIFEFMFNQNMKVTSLDLTGWTTTSATNMKNMFSSMYILTELKIGTFTTSNVTTMANMFDNERSMTSLDLRHFDTHNVTNMTKMFYNMYALQSLNLSSFNTSKVTAMEKMFIGTNTIQTLDLSTFNTSRVNNFKNMFDDMTGLQTIYVSDSFVTTGTTSTPQLFSGDINLVGGAGTTYNSSHTKLDYAHIDGGESNPGYFTRKTN